MTKQQKINFLNGIAKKINIAIRQEIQNDPNGKIANENYVVSVNKNLPACIFTGKNHTFIFLITDADIQLCKLVNDRAARRERAAVEDNIAEGYFEGKPISQRLTQVRVDSQICRTKRDWALNGATRTEDKFVQAIMEELGS